MASSHLLEIFGSNTSCAAVRILFINVDDIQVMEPGDMEQKRFIFVVGLDGICLAVAVWSFPLGDCFDVCRGGDIAVWVAGFGNDSICIYRLARIESTLDSKVSTFLFRTDPGTWRCLDRSKSSVWKAVSRTRMESGRL